MESSTSALDVSREEHKFTRASNVNVSNFVSVKLSGRSNYKIWKAQMLCLIKSQALLHIINDEYPFPRDTGVHMTAQYDELVKGWIFGSVNEKVLQDLVDETLDSAQEVWMELESSFMLPISDTSEGDSSNAIDVSARTEDFKYMQASIVNVSNFVSVKLSGHNNYVIWKTQMLCLIRSQMLLHIIDDGYTFPEDIGAHMFARYDELVKGWIFGFVNIKVLRNLVEKSLNSAQEVWMELESSFMSPISDSEASEGNSFDALDVSARAEDLKYMQASNVNVSNFVSVKLSGGKNYMIWKTQILCLIRSQMLLYIIDDEYTFPEDIGAHMLARYDELVKGWIYGSVNIKVLKNLIEKSLKSAKEVWVELESSFMPTTSDIEDSEGYSSVANDVSAIRDGLKYMQASNINVSNFITVKLSGHNNYDLWKAQMLCLLESQTLLHIINAEYPHPGDQYDKLVKGWILGSINEKLNIFQYSNSAEEVWTTLKSLFNPTINDREESASLGFMFGVELLRDAPEIENTESIRQKKLFEAAVEGCWWKAKSILKIHKYAATEKITGNGNTILHLVVEMGHNYFLEKLLEFLVDRKHIETQNEKGRTALHIAAMIGNEDAAQLLVQKRKELLVILDNNEESPFDSAYTNMNFRICAYLFKCAISSDLSTYRERPQSPLFAIVAALFTKQYDLAGTLLEKYPNIAWTHDIILFIITISFPTNLSFMESFIYPSFNNVRLKTMVRCSLLFHPNFLDKCVDDILRVVKICSNTCCNCLGDNSIILLAPIAILYPIYQLICLLFLLLHLTLSMLYFLLWKVLAVAAGPIKNIEKKKKDYQEAKKVLNIICNQMGTSNDGYKAQIFEAVRLGVYEVVDEILFMSPAALNYENDEGHNIIQLAIINRSEKVFNLIYHLIERTRNYRIMADSCGNNLAHLAGNLAPSFVLDRTTGAALQLQRELIWREEVEKLIDHVQHREENIYYETPTMRFTREHEDLVKQGESWMKTTAESCSITAALIVTIVFAAAITVPGGSNQESGIPLFKKEIAFTIFAVSNAFSLFTATTALLLFLSILTTRFSERDFLVSLPRRLILGLLTLFLSTTAMIVAFGAILFLVFCDKKPWMLAPIFGFACLPISVIVTVKLPLLVDLISSTYFPIFGKQSYLASCKINRENTIFTE